MVETLFTADEGKPVIAGTGDRVGTVERVRGEEILVDPVPEVAHAWRENTDWSEPYETDAVRLQPEAIAEVTEDEVRLHPIDDGE